MIFNYWLDPKGILHTIGDDSSHNEWARDYLISENGEDWWKNFIIHGFISPYQELHKLGWIRITIDNRREQKVRILGDGKSHFEILLILP